jgi:hypothetical protein
MAETSFPTGLLRDASKLVETAPTSDDKAVWTDLGRRDPHGFWAAHIALRHGVPDAVCHIAFHRDRWRKDLYVTR